MVKILTRGGLLVTGVTFFLLFVFFSFLVHKDIFIHFDFNTTVRLQDHFSRRFDAFFSTFSDIGSFEVMTIFLIILLIIRRKILGIIAFTLFGVIHVFELYGKTFVQQLPPPHFMLRTLHPIDYPKFYVREEFSYPSGHSARAAFVTTLIGFWVWRSKKIPPTAKLVIIGILIVYDLTMFTSRIYLGEHWASDVIGGVFLGLSLSLLSLVVL